MKAPKTNMTLSTKNFLLFLFLLPILGLSQVSEDFESGIGGWTTSGSASTGTFVVGDPDATTYQLGNDHTPSGTDALFTGFNFGGLGSDDVDGGTAIVTSPTYSITANSTLSIWYFFGQRDNNDDAGDFFRLEYSLNGGGSYTTLVFIGDVTTNPVWTEATVAIPAGSNVRIRVSAADGPGPGDIIEAGIDDLTITPLFPIILIDDVTIDEDAGTATFTARHTNSNASGSFTVNYATTDNTAVAGNDYTAASGTLNFNGTVGDTDTFTVTILDDGTFESPETFTVLFTGTSDSSVDISDTATGTIIDDDALIMTDGVTENTCSDLFLDPGGPSNYGNNQDIVYTICSDTAGSYVSVDFTSFDVRNGDLLYVYDGNSTGGTLIGQYNNNNIPDVIDSTDSSNCLTFRFVSNGSSTGEGWQANVSCFVEGPKIVINDISFDEDVGVAIFTATQTRASHGFNTIFGFVNRPFAVDFQTVDGSALAGSDYTSTSGTITFNGQIGNVQTISIPITNDGVPEFAEDFMVEFTGANANFGTINFSDTGTGTINSQIATNVPLTLFQEFDGYYDYSTTGGTLRTESNTGDACAITTSSSNTLVSPIPATATVERAYLYWAHSSNTVDGQVTFEGQTVNANFQYQTTLTTRNFYGYVSDVTSIIQGIANPSTNTFNFSGLTVDNSGNYCSTSTVLGGWALFIFYEDTSLPAVNINLYQGFDGLSNAGTSFTLDSFYAIAGSGAKASFLSWEGDSTLDGSSSGSTNPEELSITNQAAVTNILTGDGGQTGNNAYNSTIYDNTVAPIYNTSNSHGVDLDTYDISSFLSPGDTQVTANVDVGQDFVISNAVVLKVPSNLVAGTVFEDVNYPGGQGRNQVASSGIGIQGTTVEVFDSGDNFVQRTTTDINGRYSFGGIADGTYSVKVVNSTVRSNRAGGLNCSACYPIQTFRSFGNAASITEVTNEIGGADPSRFQDAAIGVLTNAQTVSSVTLAGNGIVGIDFGFNFSTIVNTNDIGQGSLEQFIINSNNLDEGILDIEANSIFDPASGDDVSIFMIPSSSDPLGRATDANFSAGVATISTLSGLTELNDSNTHIDGRTQTANIGDTNSGSIGTGGLVGVDLEPLPTYPRPEIAINCDDSLGMTLNGDISNVSIRNMAIYNATSAIQAEGDGGLGVNRTVTEVLLGTLPDGSDPGTSLRNTLYGLRLVSPAKITITSSYVGYNGNGAILGVLSNSELIATYNEVFQNGGNTNSHDGIDIDGVNGTISYNLIYGQNTSSGNPSSGGGNGIELGSTSAISGNNLIENNTIRNNTSAGVTMRNGASGNTISKNIIHNNEVGIAVNDGGGTSNSNTFSRNSIYANNGLGIDLYGGGAGNFDGITLNDDGDADTGSNDLLNFPIISAAYISNGNLVVKGWSRPGTTLEFFFTDVNEGTATAGDNTLGLSVDYGEGQRFIGSGVEGSGADMDVSSSSYSDPDGNMDTTNRFQFSLPLPSGTNLGDLVTATATLSGSTSEFSPMSILKVATIITNRRITYRINKN